MKLDNPLFRTFWCRLVILRWSERLDDDNDDDDDDDDDHATIDGQDGTKERRRRRRMDPKMLGTSRDRLSRSSP